MNKSITLPIAIVIGAAIIGVSLYMIQVNKQDSIERQKQWDLDLKEREFEADQAKIETERIDEEDAATFANEMKCQNLLPDIKRRWFNVAGISYSSSWNECVVKYKDTTTGEMEESPLSSMQDN